MIFDKFRTKFDRAEPYGGWTRVVSAGYLIASAIQVLCVVIDSELAERDARIEKLERREKQ